MHTKRLFRSESDKMVGGIIGGLGEFWGIDPTLLRLAFIFVTLATGLVPGVVLYIIALIIVPRIPRAEKRNNDKSI